LQQVRWYIYLEDRIDMKNIPLRIGVIGAGQMSTRVHLPILAELAVEGMYVLTEICDLIPNNADAAKNTFGFERSSNTADSIVSATDIDAVYIFGTVQMHHELGVRVLESGKHLFVEKPPAPTVEKLQQMIDLAEKKGLVAVVGFNRRFAEPVARLKESAATDPLRSIEGTFHKPGAGVPVPFGTESWIAANGIHALDLLLYVADELPISVHTLITKGPEGEPRDAVAVLEWKNGLKGTFLSNNSTGVRKEAYSFHWYDKTIDWVEETVSSAVHEGENTSYTYRKDSVGRGFAGEHRAFGTAIQEGVPPIHTLASAIPTLTIILAIEKGYSGTLTWDTPEPTRYEVAHTNEAAESILLLAPSAVQQHIARLSNTFTLVYPPQVGSLPTDQKEKVVAILTGPGGTEITEELLAQFPNIRVAGIVGASVRKYAPELLLARGIEIINASDAYASAVAEFVILQAMVGVRFASRSHDVMRLGGWGVAIQPLRKRLTAVLTNTLRKTPLRAIKNVLVPARNLVLGPPATGKAPSAKKNFSHSSLGLIGWGSISKETARLAMLLGCSVRVHSEHITDEEARAVGVEKADLGRVLDADIVSLHRGLTDRTRNSFGKSELDRLKPGCVFINTSRGEIVDEEALILRLQKGDIFACLDVFATEPLSPRSPLRKLRNVFLTSHLAGATGQMYQEAASVLVAKVEQRLRGEVVEGTITSVERLETMT